MNPLAILPVFLSVTSDQNVAEQRRTALQVIVSVTAMSAAVMRSAIAGHGALPLAATTPAPADGPVRHSGNGPMGTVDVVFGEVIAIHIDDEHITHGHGLLDLDVLTHVRRS